MNGTCFFLSPGIDLLRLESAIKPNTVTMNVSLGPFARVPLNSSRVPQKWFTDKLPRAVFMLAMKWQQRFLRTTVKTKKGD